MFNRRGVILLILPSLTLTLACASSPQRVTIDQYNQFAIKAAELQLWNEAVFRWNQVLEIAPQNAEAHNNIGVAYEALGKIDEAIEAYQRAAELAPDNKFYRYNYRKCRLRVERNRLKFPDGSEEIDTVEESE